MITRLFIIISIFFTCAICPSYAEAPPVEAFARRPLLASASVSPDGKYFLARIASGENRIFSVFDRTSGGLVPVYQAEEDKETYTDWAAWVNDDTVLFRAVYRRKKTVGKFVDGERHKYYSEGGSQLLVLDVGKYRRGKKNAIWLLSRNGSVVSTLPDEPDHILVQYHPNDDWPHVYKLNIRKKSGRKMVQKNKQYVLSWYTDRLGKVRMGYGGNFNAKNTFFVKLSTGKNWVTLHEKVRDLDNVFTPVGFAEDVDKIYVISNHETDTAGLYLFDLRTESFVEKLYHNSDFDIGDAVVDRRTGKLLGVSYISDQAETIWLDPTIKAEIESIGKNFLGQKISVRSFDLDSPVGMVFVSAPDFPGQYYIYDRRSNALQPLPVQYPEMQKYALGKMVTTEYKSYDGLTIPAFVTLPAGVVSFAGLNKNTPFVVMPHGGPVSRDFQSYDSRAQFFATRGFGVLQMNFRGSSGYGREFELAGRKQWGQLMQDDVSAGADWLVEQGFSDPSKMIIMGGSYGGYAALMAAVKTPEKFQCAISHAGVSNLIEIVRGQRKDSFARTYIGSRFKDGAMLRENSPQFRTEDFGIPVLLTHGFLDRVVPYEQSEVLARKLKSAGKDVEFVSLPNTGHSLFDHDDKVTFYESVERYAAGCISGQ